MPFFCIDPTPILCMINRTQARNLALGVAARSVRWDKLPWLQARAREKERLRIHVALAIREETPSWAVPFVSSRDL